MEYWEKRQGNLSNQGANYDWADLLEGKLCYLLKPESNSYDDPEGVSSKFLEWSRNLLENCSIQPLSFTMTQAEVIRLFGQPDCVSTMTTKEDAPLILKYADIELHFDSRKNPPQLFLVYSDDNYHISVSSND